MAQDVLRIGDADMLRVAIVIHYRSDARGTTIVAEMCGVQLGSELPIVLA